MNLPLHARENLVNFGFKYAVVIAEDVSVRTPGAVESVFNQHDDALREASRLSAAYHTPNSFIVRKL